jgi:hypothetical protein
MLRNRISAKMSRDRKKKEFEQLVTISKNLMNENYMLNQELEKKEKDLQFFKNTSNSLCENCKHIMLSKNLQDPCPTIFSMDDVTVEGRSNFTNYLKYSVYASFLAVMCIIGAFSLPILSPEAISSVTGVVNPVDYVEHTPRMLLSLPEIVENKTLVQNKTSTDLVLMEKLIQIYKPKDYYSKPKPVSKPTPVYQRAKENEFLGKKRRDFVNRMRQKVNIEGKVYKNTSLGGSRRSGFYDQQLCLANDKHLSWSIQDEEIKQEDANMEYIHQSSENNQLALLRDIEVEKALDSKVNSLYCNDYSSNKNQEIFKKLINQVIYLNNLRNSKKKTVL